MLWCPSVSHSKYSTQRLILRPYKRDIRLETTDKQKLVFNLNVVQNSALSLDTGVLLQHPRNMKPPQKLLLYLTKIRHLILNIFFITEQQSSCAPTSSPSVTSCSKTIISWFTWFVWRTRGQQLTSPTGRLDRYSSNWGHVVWDPLNTGHFVLSIITLGPIGNDPIWII